LASIMACQSSFVRVVISGLGVIKTLVSEL
jgi:hypothetical protein